MLESIWILQIQPVRLKYDENDVELSYVIHSGLFDLELDVNSTSHLPRRDDLFMK